MIIGVRYTIHARLTCVQPPPYNDVHTRRFRLYSFHHCLHFPIGAGLPRLASPRASSRSAVSVARSHLLPIRGALTKDAQIASSVRTVARPPTSAHAALRRPLVIPDKFTY